MQNNDNQKTYFLSMFAALARRCQSSKSSTTLFIKKPTASAIRSKITASACIHTATFGNAMETALAANIMQQTTPFLWMFRT